MLELLIIQLMVFYLFISFNLSMILFPLTFSFYLVKKRSIESITDSKTFKKAKRLGGTGNILDGHEKSSTQTMLNFIRPGLSTKNTLPSTNIEVPGNLFYIFLINNNIF